MKNSQIRLKFLGIDTLADIYLNGTHVGNTYNMHRTWEFSVRELLKEKGNLLEIRFHSPILYMEEQNRLQGKIPCNTDTIDGFPYLRKSNCMSGWDWAPKLPDMGIFRDVILEGIDEDRLEDVCVRQSHEHGQVTLSFGVHTLKTSQGREGSLLCYRDGTGWKRSDRRKFSKRTGHRKSKTLVAKRLWRAGSLHCAGGTFKRG